MSENKTEYLQSKDDDKKREYLKSLSGKELLDILIDCDSKKYSFDQFQNDLIEIIIENDLFPNN